MSDKKGLIDCYLECVKDDSKKVEQFLRLLVEYTKEVNETVSKRIRAEVLAACIKLLDATPTAESGLDKSEIREALLKLHPAASDLEELLREAELKGLERFHPDHCYAAKKDDRVRFSWPCCGIGKRIVELEKAHAIEKGGSGG